MLFRYILISILSIFVCFSSFAQENPNEDTAVEEDDQWKPNPKHTEILGDISSAIGESAIKI